MQIQIFNVPITDSGELQAELNRFLAGHKVLEIEQRFFQNEKGGYWSFCVRYISGAPASTGAGSPAPGKPKVDYKLLLSERDFAIFTRLREIRKQLATEDGVPAYAVFTDEELSGIARLTELNEKNMSSISGIGEKKVTRYGGKMIELLTNVINNSANNSGATSGNTNNGGTNNGGATNGGNPQMLLL